MTTALDPTISAQCDLASHVNATDAAARDIIAVWAFADAGWLVALVTGACFRGLTLGQQLASMARMDSGYRTEPVRRETRARKYRDGFAHARRRVPAAQARVNREARILGLAS